MFTPKEEKRLMAAQAKLALFAACMRVWCAASRKPRHPDGNNVGDGRAGQRHCADAKAKDKLIATLVGDRVSDVACSSIVVGSVGLLELVFSSKGNPNPTASRAGMSSVLETNHKLVGTFPEVDGFHDLSRILRRTEQIRSDQTNTAWSESDGAWTILAWKPVELDLFSVSRSFVL